MLTAYMRQDIGGAIKYKWVPIDQISPYLRQAAVLAEDDRFYEHKGFDWDAIKEATKRNLKRKKFAYGGSTITMQLARNLYLSPDKSIFRKVKEISIALKLERELSKRRILELYLNVAEWGNDIYGAYAASRHYFGKNPSELTKYEAAFLAAVLPRPKYYDKHRNSALLQERTASLESRL